MTVKAEYQNFLYAHMLAQGKHHALLFPFLTLFHSLATLGYQLCRSIYTEDNGTFHNWKQALRSKSVGRELGHFRTCVFENTCVYTNSATQEDKI